MNFTQKILLGIGGTLTLGFATSSLWAQTAPATANNPPAAAQPGIQTGDGHRMHRGKGREGGARALLTPAERTAFREKMRGAKTPDERRQIAMANRAEVEKRAREKGITLPERRGMRGEGKGRHGRNSTPTPTVTSPATVQ